MRDLRSWAARYRTVVRGCVIGWGCALAALWADSAAACTVCYGDSEAAVIRGAEQATLLLVGVTYLVLGGGGVAFVVLRQRARRSATAGAGDHGAHVGHPFCEDASSQGASK